MSLSERLVEFLEGNHVLCLSTAAAGQSYSAPVFYLFVPGDVSFVFLSDPASRHCRDALMQPDCSAAIFTHTREVSSLKGAQILGKVVCDGPTTALAKGRAEVYATYLRRYPEAEGRQSSLWRLIAGWIKFTDNTRGFGSKEVWVR